METDKRIINQINRVRESLATTDHEIDYELQTKLAAEQWQNMSFERDRDVETLFLHLSSDMRDTVAYPSSSSYKIALTAPIEDIVEAQLVSGTVSLDIELIDNTNQLLNFTLNGSPILTATITRGRYTGVSLAVEITRRMNEQAFSAQIIAGTMIIEQSTGRVQNFPALTYVADQVNVSYRASDMKFIFQVYSAALMPVTTNLSLYIQNPIPNVIPSLATTDIFTQLGFDRNLVMSVGVPFPATNSTIIQNDIVTIFSSGLVVTVDALERHGIRPTSPADLSGPNVLIVDIQELNDNDTIFARTTPSSSVHMATAFGYIIVPTNPIEQFATFDFNSSSSALTKKYKEGKPRLMQLTINLRRLDGQIFNFLGNSTHFFTFKIVRKRKNPVNPVIFTR